VTLDQQAGITRSNALVSGLEDADQLCEDLDPGKWNDQVDRTLREYDDADDQLFRDIATRIRGLANEDDQLSMLTAFNQLVCAIDEGENE
jgi:hypothetical protein